MINKYLDKQGTQVLANAINSKQNALTFDATPTTNSTNPVTSGGIKTSLDKKIDVINLEEYCPHLLQELVPTMQSGTPVALSQTALAEYRSLSDIEGKYCKIPSMMGNEMFKLDRFDHGSAAESSDRTCQSVTYFNNTYYCPWSDNFGTEWDKPELNSIMIVHTYYIDNNWQHTENNDYQVVSRNITFQDKIEWDTVPTAGSRNAVRSSGIKTYVDTAISNLPEPMVFKGSLGTGGTITALPVNGTASVGDTYKVITDGTYASKAAKAGDTFICLTKTANTNTWELIPSGDEPSGTVTSVGMTVPTGLSVSGSPVTSSGTLAVSYANGYSIPTTAKQTEWDEKLVYYDLDQDPNIAPIFGGDLPQADLNAACEHLLTVLNDNSEKVIYRFDGYNFIGEHHEGLPWNDGGSTNSSDACNITLELAIPMQGLLSTLRLARENNGNWQMASYTYPLQPQVSGSGNAITGVDYDVMNGEFILEKNATFQEQLVSGTNIKTINNTSLLGSGNISITIPASANTRAYRANDCTNAAGTVAKTASCSNYVLAAGSLIAVKFTNTNTAASATLNLANTGAKTIRYNNAALTTATAGVITAGSIVTFIYDGSYYHIINVSADGVAAAIPLATVQGWFA